MNTTKESSWLINTLMLVVCAAVAYSTWSLVVRNHDLRRELDDLRTTTSVSMLGAGDHLPAVAIRAPAGQTGTLDTLVAEGALVAFLTTTCPFCEATLPTWSELAAAASRTGTPFIALSLDGQQATSAYAEAMVVDFPLWVLETTSTVAVPIERVPLTVMTGVDGTVTGYWLGQLDRRDVEEIQDGLARLDENRILSRSTAGDPACCNAAASGTEPVGRQAEPRGHRPPDVPEGRPVS